MAYTIGGEPMAIDAKTKQFIKQKAESNTPMDIITDEKKKLYDEYQNYFKNQVRTKALSGQQLDNPNDWKNSLYQGYQQEPINNLFSQSQDMVNKLYDAQKQSQLSQLRASQQQAVGQLNQQKAELSPQYQSMRNQTDASNLQNVQRLREVMAASGLGASGENVTANVGMNNARLSSLNDLNLQEQQAINDINRQITDVNNPMEEQKILSEIESQRALGLYNAWNNAQTQGYQRLRDTISDNRYNQQYQDEKAWREYTYNNLSEAQKRQFDIMESQFGEEMAWRMFELNYRGELDKSLAQTQIDGYTNFLIP